MRRVGVLVFLILLVAFGASAQTTSQIKKSAGDETNTGAATHDFASTPAPHPSGAYGDLPLSFEANRGQADSQVKYMARGRGYTLFLTPKETVLALRHALPAKQKPAANAVVIPPGLKHETVQWAEDVVRFKLAGTSANPKMEGVEKLSGVSNYYIGNDPSRWQSGIPNYRKVVYRDAYPGIDVTYYGNPGLLESDFIVAPGADPSAIAWDVEGAAKLRVNEAGDLILETADASMRLQKPVVYQVVAGERREVSGAYRVDRNTVRFAVGEYDRSETLIIDPTLSYSTYLGGSNGASGDVAYGVAVDTAGEAYVTGQASSTDFPTQSPFQGAIGDGSTENAFVAKFSASGSSLIFSTYLGGSGTDQGAAVALDGSGNAYVAGTAGSTNFPLLNPLTGQSEHIGGDCGFVSSFSATGTLSFSTYLCGGVNDDALRIRLDSNKDVYVGGNTQSPNFPTVNPLQPSIAGTLNTYVAKLAPITPTGGSSLLYSTFFGGNNLDFLQGLALDSGNNIYVSGSTNSSTFPTKNPIQSTLKAQNGEFNSFVAEINAAGNALVYSTYLGGSVSDANTGLAVDGSGNAYMVGDTRSPDFPVKNPLQALDPGGDAYVAKIAAGGATLDFSTYFGPANPEFDEFFGGGIALDSAVPPNIYITGATSSQVLPTRLPLQATSAGFGSAAFITEFKNDGSDYIFSTYLAGSSSPSFQGDRGFGLTLDSNNNIYVVGQTSTLDFPTVNPFQADLKDTTSTNGFVAKISPATPATPQLFPASLNFGPVLTASSSQPQVVTLANGTAALTITSVVVSGPNAADFSSFSTCGQTVPATVACNFTVTFTPSTTGTEETATVTINESGNSPQVFTLSGIGATTIPPPPLGTITVNPTTLPSFGNEEVSITSASQFFTVTVGTNPVTLQFTESTLGDFIQGSGGTNPCSFETPLPVGTVCQIAVAFDPQVVGLRNETFQVFGTFTGSPAGVAVSGTGTAKIASLTPTNVSFPNQVVGTTSSPMVVTLMNVSAAGGPSLTNIATLPLPAGFMLSSTTCPTGTAGLSPGQSCVFNIVFSPTSAGFAFGTFTVTDSDPALQSVSLSGTGLNATATLAPVSPTSLEFGRQTAGTTSNPLSVFLQNTGNTTLTFTTPIGGASPNAFQATNSCSGAITVAASNCSVNVTFTPTGAGPFFATLTIQSSAIGAPQTVLLSGTGIPTTTASLLPNPLVFPTTAMGVTSGVEYAFLNNTGPVADTVQNITIGGADPADFQWTVSAPAQACSPGMLLNAQAVCVVGVTFTPTQAGTRTATLQVTDTATNTPQTITLQGTATGTGGVTLTVMELGTGTGTVSSTPTGILCPSTCTAGFTSGQVVTLSATANSGSTLGSFSTNCTPASPQTNPPSCTVTLNGAATTVNVTFNTAGGGLTISPSTLPNGAIGGAYGQTLQVSGGTAPYNFTISAGTLPAGLNLGATSGTIGGVPTGPASASTFTVSVTDSSTPPLAGSANFTITIGAADSSNNSELNGQYAFLFQGFNDSDGTMVVVAGSFVSDGHGNILPGGFEDANGSTGAQPTQEIASGTYTIGADNRGTMSLTTPSGTTVLAISVGDIQAGVATKARFIRFDDVSGTNGHTGSGVILKQDNSIFALAAIKGSYAFGETGSNLTNGNPESGVGFLNSDGNGNFTPAGVIDLDDGGTLVSGAAISGTYQLTNETNSAGRLSASLTIAGVNGTISDVLYIVSSSQAVFISINTTLNTIYSGITQLQVPPAGGFGLGSLSGNAVVALQGKRADGTSVVGVGNATLDGNGNFTLAFDQNKGGTSTTGTAGGTYTVAANGRAVFTVTTGTFNSRTAFLYLDGTNQGFFAATDNAASEGFFEPGGNNFNNASLSGKYFLGTFDPTALQASDLSGVASFDGIGTLQTTTDETNPVGNLEGDKQISTPYNIALNGRLTFTATQPVVGYVASGCEAEIITTNGANPGLASFECQVTPASAETLTVTLAGTGSGTVTDGTGAINCPTTCTANFPSGTQITLTAFPDDGSTFTGWSGANSCEGTGTCTFTITANTPVTANFSSSTNFALTVSETGTGTGTVTSAPTGISCPTTCSANFASGTSATLTAVAAEGSTFAGWSGSGCSGTGTCVVTVTATTPVTATFNTTNNFALTVSEIGTGSGTVMSAPAGIVCPTTCSANFASGTSVTLTAVAAEGSTFAGWTGGGCSGSGTCVVTVTAATPVTATFNSGNTPVIISVGPGSSSTVNTVPGGSAVFGLVLTGQTGFTGTVQLTCTSPIASITCAIVPSSVTLNGTTTSVAIVVNTFCKGFIPNGGPSDGPNGGPTPGGFGMELGILLVALSLCGAAWTYKKQPRWAVSFGLLIIFGVGMSACSNLAKSPSGSATPPGSYPLVVTATPPTGAPSHVNLVLVVK